MPRHKSSKQINVEPVDMSFGCKGVEGDGGGGSQRALSDWMLSPSHACARVSRRGRVPAQPMANGHTYINGGYGYTCHTQLRQQGTHRNVVLNT